MRSQLTAAPADLFPLGDDRMQDGEGLGAANRAEFIRQGVVAVNLMGGPASGRTELVQATARALAPRRTGALLAGPAVEIDARRLAGTGLPAQAIPTHRRCHLDAEAVDLALKEFAWRYLDYLFVENVGGLVSPASHHLGETLRVVALPVTDGAAQPLKYPDVFRTADLVVVTKADLLNVMPQMSLGAIAESLACVMRRPAFVVTSAVTGEGLAEWGAWLERSRKPFTMEPARGPAFEPARAEEALAFA